MGEDEWAHREPGSATGSVVPPPVVQDEPPPIRPALPRRQPKASGHQRAADADKLTTPVRRVSGSTGPEISVAGPTQAGPAQTTPTRRNARLGQPRLQLADQPAAASPQLPDNVRYLFKPVLTQTARADTGAEPANTQAEPDAERRAAERGSVPATSAGHAGAPAAGKPRRQPAEPTSGEPARRPKTVATAGSHRRSAAAVPGGKLRRRVTWAAAVVVVASTAVGTVLALVRHGPTANSVGQQGAGAQHSTRGGRTGPNNGLPGLSSAAIVRAQAARWVAREISKSAIIACDALMCANLFNQGIAASNLLVLSPTAPSPLGADIVVATPALRHQFRQRLAGEYAPTVIASFGFGNKRVAVRVIASDGAAAYELALSRDLAARQRYGGVLLRNSRISVSASARPDLIAGLVDPRLLMMLPVLANQHPIKILGFYDRAPSSAQGVPLSGAELAGYDAASGLSADGYLRWLLVFLHGQRAPYWPTSVSTALVGSHEIVRVRFSRPSPIGFLNGQ